MAVCKTCDQEMTDHVGCVGEPVTNREGEARSPIKHAGDPGTDCHDCGAPPAMFHHPGCDAERCPFCGGQLISCGCLSDADEDPEGDD